MNIIIVYALMILKFNVPNAINKDNFYKNISVVDYFKNETDDYIHTYTYIR